MKSNGNFAQPLLAAACMAAMIGAVLSISNPALYRFIEDSGVNIPTADVLTDFTWGIVWACLLLASIALWPVPWRHKKILGLAWVVKCVVALGLMLPYEQRYYGLDCWHYFQRAHLGLAGIGADLWRGGAEVVCGVGALHLAIGPDSYHAMKLSFAFLGLAGLYLFYRAAEQLLGRPSLMVFWAITLYPSILFWSSILGKDPVILLAIGVHVWGLVNLMQRGKHGYLVAVLGGIAGASAVRIWMGPILILPCLLLLGTRIKHLAWRIVAIAIICAALAVLGPATLSRFGLDQTADLVEASRTLATGWDRANSSLAHDVEINSLWDLILFTPQGLFSAYFRPLPGDVANLFGWLAGFENLGLLALSIWAALHFRFSLLKNSFFSWGLGLLITWGLAYSVIAYRDLGSAVRFRLQILPILLGMIGHLLWAHPRFPRKRRAAVP